MAAKKFLSSLIYIYVVILGNDSNDDVAGSSGSSDSDSSGITVVAGTIYCKEKVQN